MKFAFKEVVALRDHSNDVHLLQIEKQSEDLVDISLGKINELWGNPDGSIILRDNLLEGFFDKNAHFHFQFKANKSTAIFLEVEDGHYLEDLNQLDNNIRVILLITDFSNSKINRIIYSFFLQPGQVLNIQGKKVKSRRIQNYIQTEPEDLGLRVLLLKELMLGWKEVYKSEDVLTAQQFADYLKMPIGTFQNKLSKGEIIAPKKIGGSNRWLFKDIQDWMNFLSKT